VTKMATPLSKQTLDCHLAGLSTGLFLVNSFSFVLTMSIFADFNSQMLNRYVLFGTCTSRTRTSATFSSGHTVKFNKSSSADSTLQVNGHYFVTVYQKGTGPYRRTLNHYVIAVSTIEDTAEMSRAFRELTDATQVSKLATQKLSDKEQRILAQYLSITLSGGVTLLSAAAAGWEVVNWCTGGPINPLNLLISGVAAVCSGGLTAIQFQELTKNQQHVVELLTEVERTYDVLSRLMRKHQPSMAEGATPLNTSIVQLVDTLKEWFNVDSRYLWSRPLEAKEVAHA